MYYRYEGPVAFDQAFNGTAPNSASVQAAYTVTQNARANVIQPNNILTQGLTYHLYTGGALTLDYKYSRFTSNSTGNLQQPLERNDRKRGDDQYHVAERSE